jgi:hypothetical protein
VKSASFLFVLLSCWLILSCSNQTTQTKASSTDTIAVMKEVDESSGQETIESPVDLKATKRIIDQNKQKLSNVTGSFKDFKTFVQSLDDQSLYTISSTADYLRIFLKKADVRDRDSSYLYFQRVFYLAVNTQTDALRTNYPKSIKEIEMNGLEAASKNIQEYFSLFGAGLFMSEGMVYLDVLPDYFSELFKDHVSPALSEYLAIRELELAEGFSEDAGLVISFEQVYQRVLRWEKLVQENPDFILVDWASNYWETYLETLLTGMDNSRVFDFEGELKPEIKQLYELIVEKGYETKSGAIIRGYYNRLGADDFKYSEDLDEYLKSQGLNSMLGIQPHSR